MKSTNQFFSFDLKFFIVRYWETIMGTFDLRKGMHGTIMLIRLCFLRIFYKIKAWIFLMKHTIIEVGVIVHIPVCFFLGFLQ